MEKKQVYNLTINYLAYKIQKCSKKKCKKVRNCNYYHNSLDKRRNLIRIKYNYLMCDNVKNCFNKDNCSFSHNMYESMYHPSYYKTIYCLEYLETKNCTYGKYCYKAHSNEEIKIELIHKYKIDFNFLLFKFKTVFCPLKFLKHNKETCVYSHNYQDFRRIPNNNYINSICKNWVYNKMPDIYEHVCKINCNYFHGWKEIEYHFSNYKKIKCKHSYDKCRFKIICSKIHYKQDDNYIKNKNLAIKNLLVFVPKKL